MKGRIIFTILTGTILFLACTGQNGTAEKEKEAYVNEIDAKLKKVEDYIIGLRERADNVLTENKAQFEAQIDSLARKQDAAEAKLSDLKMASAQKWQSLEAEMDSLMAELDSLSEATRDW